MRQGEKHPWFPAEWEKADAQAIKALSRGIANEHQQKRALAWIVNKAGMLGQQSFIADDPHGRISAFLEGRRSVPNQILKLIDINLENIHD